LSCVYLTVMVNVAVDEISFVAPEVGWPVTVRSIVNWPVLATFRPPWAWKAAATSGE
jgi:hypothetical protein